MPPKKLDEPMPGQCQCLRCDYVWWPAQPVRVHRPKQCPSCKSRYWDKTPQEVPVKGGGRPCRSIAPSIR